MSYPAPFAANPLAPVLEAGRADSVDAFVFVALNRSVEAVPYDRASLWRCLRRPETAAVSGAAVLDADSAFARGWAAALAALKPGAAGLLDDTAFSTPDAYRAKAAETGGVSALWLPVPGRDDAFLFERWGDRAFTPAEAAALGDLVAAYALAWPGKTRGKRRTGRLVFWGAFAAIVAAMFLVRLPLRVVAPCEVTPRTPHLVAAPMNGIIDEIAVQPGQTVAAGEVLARYDARLMEDELAVSRRQVAVVEAELASARARGFNESRYRGEIALLEARLEQENARQAALEARYGLRLVTAGRGGVVQLDDARAWRGRPVSTGQAIMWLVEPDDSRVSLWLPQDDRIDLDLSRPIHIHLHALGGAARRARLTYVSSFAQPGADGVYAFPAEAEWLDDLPPPPLGLRGTASLYGEETSLGSWLFRRPLAWLRRQLGI